MNFSTKFAYLFIIIGTIYWAFSDTKPAISDAKKIEEQTGFSLNTALYHLKNIAKETHYPGTTAHKEVQQYIVNELTKIGLEAKVETQVAYNSKWIVGTATENIVARIKGTEQGKALLLLSHYDSNPHSAIGASDAGSGVVTILEGIRAFLEKNQQPKNDIIILISDAEELGLLGAKAFVETHPWASDVGLVLNFEARGSGGPSYMLMETNGSNSKLLTEFVKSKPKFAVANSLMYSIYKKLPNDTDLTVFREEGDINGFNFAFIGDHYDYHTAQDSYERLDRESLLHQADYLMATLPYFANADLSNLNSDKDLVYTNFPLLTLLSYPFSYILSMLLIAIALFLVLLFFGISLGKVTSKGALQGFIPFLIVLIVVPLIGFGLWKGLKIIHPHYNDMLHKFTYNGYEYIVAFSFLFLWICFKAYNTYFKKVTAADLLIAPIVFWLIINTIIYFYLQGAAFFILPVFIGLLVLAVLIFMNLKSSKKPILFSVLSIPVIYIFGPMVKMFPVGLGLDNLFISGIFIALLFGLLAPVFHQKKRKNSLQTLFGFLAIAFFAVATYNNGFNVNNKKPNSLVYIQSDNTNTAYFGTYNFTSDNFIKQKLGENPTEGHIQNAETYSKYGNRFRYHAKTDSKNIASATINIEKDTIYDNKRHLDIRLTPNRKITKMEILSENILNIKELTINETLVNKGKSFTQRKGRFMIYYFANTDENVSIKLTCNANEEPAFILNEISNDLLSNPKFDIKPRAEDMMPMPFVTNDAIITSKKIQL